MRKKQIIEEAFKLFARQGYGPTTMQQIGSAVGLDKSSLYAHFKNKSDIFTVILETELQSYTEAVLEASLKGKDFKEVCHNLINETLGYFSNQNKLLFWKYVMLMSNPGAYPELSALIRDALFKLNYTFAEQLKAAISHTDDPAAKQKIALCLFMITQGLMDWMVLREDMGEQDQKLALEVCDSVVSTFGLS